MSVACSGLQGQPDLSYVLQLYDQNQYGAVQVRVHNATGKQLTVQAIRSVEAVGAAILNLGGNFSADRVLSNSFSEDWPDLKIFDFPNAPGGIHRGAGSQLVYNKESKQSFFVGALTSDRFLTILRLGVENSGGEGKISSYTVDSTSTTETQKQYDCALKNAPPDA